MIYIGVDPGKNGGIAYVINGEIVEAVRMPETEKGIREAFRKIKLLDGNCIAKLEQVHAFPGQGVSSMFKFGTNYGYLKACMDCMDIDYDLVTPQKWQKSFINVMTDTKSEHKNNLKEAAKQYYPKGKVTLYTADAILLAVYCYLTKSKEGVIK